MVLESLSFPTRAHRQALETVLRDADADSDVCGVLVCGSIARGDALPGSDLDVRVFLHDDASERAFNARDIGGIWVEITARTVAKAQARLQERPIEVYPYLEAVVLRDEGGAVQMLVQQARAIYDFYRATDADRDEWRYWLQSTERKLHAAQSAQMWEKCAYLTATSSWPLLSGLWTAANRPLLPSGAVRFFLPDVCARIPSLTPQLVWEVFRGATVEARTEAFLLVLHRILPLLESPG